MDDFSRIYQSYYTRVHRYLRALSGSEQQADNLTQEVFYRALLHIGTYRDCGSMYAWLCAIGKNAWLDACRKQRRLVSMDDALPQMQGTAPDPEAVLLEQERQDALRTAILELPAEYRDVVILHVYGEIPLREIAAQKGKSESWGKVTFYRAKRLLAQKLEGLY